MKDKWGYSDQIIMGLEAQGEQGRGKSYSALWTTKSGRTEGMRVRVGEGEGERKGLGVY